MNNKKIILEYSYWEHFKSLKDISLILPIEHKKRKKLKNEIDNILNQIHKLK
jgi:hypothetical protein